jgi:hypothetical protein
MHAFDVTFFILPAACPCPGVKKKQNKKHVSKKAVINLLARSKMASKSTSRQKLLSSMFYTLLFMVTFVTFINHVLKPMLTNNLSQILLKGFLYSGSSILALQVSHFVSEQSMCEHNSFTLTTRNQAQTRSTYSFGTILTLFYPHQVVLILNRLKPSISQLSTASLMSCQRSLKKKVSLWKTYTIWMRRDVREVVEKRVLRRSTSTL